MIRDQYCHSDAIGGQRHVYLLSKNCASPLPAETKINMGGGRVEFGERE